jgi:hypothetical protein
MALLRAVARSSLWAQGAPRVRQYSLNIYLLQKYLVVCRQTA